MPEGLAVPATGEYLALGLGVSGTLMLLFIVSIIARMRNLQRDAQTLEEIARGD
jgi:hypothetical protein